MEKQEMKDFICDYVEKSTDLIEGIADYIHANPELGREEKRASAYLRNLLAQQGFVVSDIVPEEFPTAFHAVKGTGALQIGFLAEYDALPEIGHGCGHNLIAAMSVGAALAFAAAAADQATIHVYGCPAEETAGSKVYMTEAGVFDQLDAALIIHPANETAIGGTSYATHPLQVTFIGKEAHVADKEYHGINALDALVDYYGQLKQLNETFEKPHIIGSIITEGGIAPNIIPARATLRSTIRALDTDYLETVMLPQIKALAAKVAAAHQTGLECEYYEPLCKSMVNDTRMDVYFAENFNHLYEEFSVKPDDDAEGSTDVGNVSHIIRVSQPEIGIGGTKPAHTAEFAATTGSAYAKMQAVTGAKAMAMVAADVLFEK